VTVTSILIVDDSATIRRMVRAALQAVAEAQFVEAETGLEAIERLAFAPVGLIVLDLNMPDMHGLEVLRFVRAHAAYRDTPVLVLTTRQDDASRAAALAAGATAYVTKPFAPATLAAEARKLLEHGGVGARR
jgi:two-component system, chemotaxis family, chemotaxis protein CheY